MFAFMHFSPMALATRRGATPQAALLLAFACLPSLAEQPPWGWTEGRPPGVHRGQGRRLQQQDPWYPGDEQWATAETLPPGEEQQFYNPDDDFGFLRPDERQGRNEDGNDKTNRRQTSRRGPGKDGRRSEGDEEFDNEGEEDARTDFVKAYTRSFKGRVMLSGGASLSGAMLGAVISKSTIHRTPTMSLVGLLIGLILSVAKGPFGDLFRAMGLAVVLAVRRSGRLSSEYPILPYARRALLMRPRRPFPPAENPWRYRRADALAEMDGTGVGGDGSLPPEFSMAKSLLSLAFLGGFAGYLASQLVFLPTFLLALGGGGFLAYLATTGNARGDLSRLIGMRTVAFLGLLSEIDSDAGLSQKAQVVGGICFSKALFWDSKYHIKDRIVVLLSNLYAALAQLVQRVQRDAAGIKGYEDNDYDVESEEELGHGNQEAFSRGGARQQKPRKGSRRQRQPDGGRSRPPVPPPPPPARFQGGENRQYPQDE